MDKNIMTVSRNGVTITFDIIIEMAKGAIYCGYFKRIVNEVAAAGVEPPELKLNIKQAHARLGHSNEATTRRTAQALGITITCSTMLPCMACTIGKAKQKNVPKLCVATRESIPGRTVHLDIATVKSKPGEPRMPIPNMCVIVCAASRIIFYNEYKRKNDMPEATCERFNS